MFPETGELRVFKRAWFTYETVIQSFRDLVACILLPEGMKFCIVFDNAPWHKKAVRLIWGELPEYADIRDKMEYLSLPPYSPDLKYDALGLRLWCAVQDIDLNFVLLSKSWLIKCEILSQVSLSCAMMARIGAADIERALS